MDKSTPQKISSADNTFFKHLKKIANSARERRKHNQTLLDGIHLLKAAADSGCVPEVIVLCEGVEHNEEIQQVVSHFSDIKLIELQARLFDQLSPVDTPVGILSLVHISPRKKNISEACVMLENIQDPGNMGSIMRTTVAAGIDKIYLSKGCAEAWSPKALRAGMGAQFQLNIVEHCELEQELQYYQKVFVTSLSAATSLYSADITGSTALLFGNEGSGVSDKLITKASHKIHIPMPGNVESLNVAAAVAICLFERVRQVTLQR